MQRHGITPTSSDPWVATVFATQAERFGEAVVEIYPRRALQGVPVHEGYIAREAEWPVELSPGELSSRASVQVPSSVAREILSEMEVARFVEEAHKRV